MIKLILTTLLALTPNYSHAALSDLDKAEIAAQNILKNPGFESGRSEWSVTGGVLSNVTSGDNLGFGKTSVCWDASAATHKMQSSLITIPKALYGKYGQIILFSRNASGVATHKIRVTDGTNNVTASDLDITSSATYARNSTGFIFPSSGSVRVELEAQADEPETCFDMGYVGVNQDLINIGPNAELVGSVNYVGIANCNWTVTSTTFASFGADTDCNTATVTGKLIAPSTKIPGFQLNKQVGTYLIKPRHYYSNFTTGASVSFRMTDGTDSSKEQPWLSRDAGTSDYINIPDMTFESTSNGLVTVQLQTRTSSGTVTLVGNSTVQNYGFDVYYFPPDSQKAIKPDQTNYGWTSYTPTFTGFGTVTNISCYHKRDGENLLVRCTHTNGTTTATEARVSFPSGLTSSSLLPTLESTGQLVTRSETTASHPVVLREPSVTYFTFGQIDGSATQLAKANGNTFASTTTWSWEASVRIQGWIENQKAPVLIGSITNDSLSSERIMRVRIANSGTPTITSQSGEVASLTDNGTGDVTVNITAGKFTETPSCTCSAQHTTLARFCYINSNTAPSATAIRFQVANDAGAAEDRDFNVICVGPR